MTGVQTCALPIFPRRRGRLDKQPRRLAPGKATPAWRQQLPRRRCRLGKHTQRRGAGGSHAGVAAAAPTPAWQARQAATAAWPRGQPRLQYTPLVVLPAELGYATAIATLKKRFGSKHSIAKSYVDGVRSGPRILPNDVEGLLKYSSDLNLTFVVLSQLQYASDINSTETMTQCVKRLPFNLVNSWVKQAARISLNQDRDPNFYDFVKFVEAHAEFANTYYGRENAKL